jgi:hypothetical protein
MVRHPIAIGIVMGALALLPLSRAQAASAFAAGVPDDVAKAGVALGEAHNFSSREEAEAGAMDQCRKQPDSPEAVHALCKIMDHFDNRCLAMSLDPKDGTPGWGWGIADTLDAARDQAMASCRASAGDRAPYCQVTNTACDGSANKP